MAYALGIYLLNMFLAFLSPKFDPASDAIDNEMEDGSGGDAEVLRSLLVRPEGVAWSARSRRVSVA